MKGYVFVADAIQEASGKLSVLGGFWSRFAGSVNHFNIGMVLVMEEPVEWDGEHSFVLVLEPVTEDATEITRIEGGFKGSPKPNVPEGAPIVIAKSIGVGCEPLPPGIYKWSLSVDGALLDHWTFWVAEPERKDAGSG